MSAAVDKIVGELSLLTIDETRAIAPPVTPDDTSKKDLARLAELEVVDHQGAVSSLKCLRFPSSLDEDAKQNLAHFMDPNQMAGKIVLMIRGTLASRGMPLEKVVIIGEELCHLLGFKYLSNRLAELIASSPKIPNADPKAVFSSESLARAEGECSAPPSVLTIRFKLDRACSVDDRKKVVEQIFNQVAQLVGYQNVTLPFPKDDQKTHLSLIACQLGNQKIYFVFASELQSQFVASGDGVQVAVHENGEFEVLDNGCGYQWAVDTYFQILRVLHAESSNVPLIMLRYVERGCVPTEKDYQIFKEMCLTGDSTNGLLDLWRKLNNGAVTPESSLKNIFLISQFCGGSQSYRELHKFFNASVQEHEMLYGKLEEKRDFWSQAALLIKSKKISFPEWEALFVFFGSLSQATPTLSSHISNELGRPIFVLRVGSFTYKLAYDLESVTRHITRLIPTLQSEPAIESFIAHFNDKWMEVLLVQPHLQGLGQAMILAPTANFDLKKKWCPVFLRDNPTLGLRLMLQVQSLLDDNDIEKWIKNCPQKSLIVSELLRENSARFQAVSARCFPQESFNAYEVSRARPLLVAITQAALPGSLSASIAKAWAKEGDCGVKVLPALVQHIKETSENDWKEWIEYFFQRGLTASALELLLKLPSKEQEAWVSSAAVRCPEEALKMHHILAKNGESADLALLLLKTLTKTSNLFGLISAWAKQLRENSQILGVARVSVSDVFVLLTQHKNHAEEWGEDYVTCFKLCTQLLSEKLTRQHCLELLALALHPQALAHGADFVSAVLRAAAFKEGELAPVAKSEVRACYRAQVLALRKAALDLESICLFKIQQTHCKDPLPREEKEALIDLVLNAANLPEAILQWYLSLELGYGVRPLEQQSIINQVAPKLIGPKCRNDLEELAKRIPKVKEKEPQPVKEVHVKKEESLVKRAKLLLLQTQDQDGIENVVVELLQLSPPDPNGQVFALLKKYSVYNLELWRKAFARFDLASLPERISQGVRTLIELKESMPEEIKKRLWLDMFENGSWICYRGSLAAFKHLEFFKQLCDLSEPPRQVQLASLLAGLIGLIEKDVLLRKEYYLFAYKWFEALLRTNSQWSSLGWQYVLLCDKELDLAQFKKASSVLVSLMPHLRSVIFLPGSLQVTKGNDKQKRKSQAKAEQKVFKIAAPTVTFEPLLPYLEAATQEGNRAASIAPLRALIHQLQTFDSLEVDEFLIRKLGDHAEISVKDALAKSLVRRLLGRESENRLEFIDICIRLRDTLLQKGSIESLREGYKYIFLSSCKEPTNNKLTWKQAVVRYLPAAQAAQANDLVLLCAPSYPRYLRASLASGDAAASRAALEIDLTLSRAHRKNAAFLRRELNNEYPRVLYLIFLQQLEHFGWDNDSGSLFRHLVQSTIAPWALHEKNNPERDDLSLVHEECYKVISRSTTNEYYYQFSLPKKKKKKKQAQVKELDKVVIAIPLLSHSRTDPLLSETAYVLFTHDLIRLSIERAKEKGKDLAARGRLLDFACANLRNLVELYPQNQVTCELVRSLCFAINPDDTNFQSHAYIVGNLLKLAVVKKAISPGSELLIECLHHINRDERVVQQQNLEHLFTISREIDRLLKVPSDFSEDALLKLQKDAYLWLHSEFVDGYEPFLECVNKLFALWRAHHLVINNSEVLRSMDSLLIPFTNFFGVGRGAEGERFALASATLFFDCLCDIYNLLKEEARGGQVLRSKELEDEYQELSLTKQGSLQVKCLKVIATLLTSAMRLKAFEKHYDEYCQLAKKCMALVMSESNTHLVVPCAQKVTMALCKRVPGKENQAKRVALVDEWMEKIAKSEGPFKNSLLIEVASGLIRSDIIRAMEAEDFPIVLKWLHHFTPIHKKLEQQQLEQLARQVRSNKAYVPGNEFRANWPDYLKITFLLVS